MQTLQEHDLFINTVTLEYPITLGEIRRKHPNVSFGRNPSTYFILNMGYSVVHPTTRPIGQVVLEAKPALTENLWRQVWTSRDYSAEEIADQLTSAKRSASYLLKHQFDKALEAGAEVGFGNKPHLRACIKDSSIIDLLTLKSLALDAIREGDDWSAFEFRGLGGEVVSLEALQAVCLVGKALARRSALKSLLGSLLDSVGSALVVGDIDHSENAFEIE